jgi:uncharacterized protein (TIGR02284 family)
MTDFTERLVAFRDKLTDARKGFERAAGDVTDPELRELFARAAEEKRTALSTIQPFLPPEADEEGGTLIGTVTQVIVAARAAITGAESLLPGMVDGEKRVLEACDEARAAAAAQPEAASTLDTLRQRIAGMVADLEARRAAAN